MKIEKQKPIYKAKYLSLNSLAKKTFFLMINKKYSGIIILATLLLLKNHKSVGQVHLDSLPLQHIKKYWNEVGIKSKKLKNNFVVVLSDEPLQSIDIKVKRQKIYFEDTTLVILFSCSKPESMYVRKGIAPHIFQEMFLGLNWYGLGIAPLLGSLDFKKKSKVSYIAHRKVSILVLDYKYLSENFDIHFEQLECAGLGNVKKLLPHEFGSPNPMVFLFQIF